MTNDLIDTKQLEIHAEHIENAMEMASRGAAMAVSGAITAGTKLLEVKAMLPHGELTGWIRKNVSWNYDTAVRYMRIASNLARVPDLKDAKSIRLALRMISEENAEPEQETAPRSERKSGQVEVVEPDEPGQTDVQPDDDPTPDPPTQRKTAKGSEKKPESSKPKTQPITPEIIDEPKELFPEERSLSDWSETQILDYLVATADEPKPRAKRLRKTADRLDPPTKFVKPELDEVALYFMELKATDPDSFFDFYESKGWLVGKVSMKDWRASARKWVRENQSNGKEGKGNGSAHRGTGKAKPTGASVFG